jgi:hypothetical protein
MRIQRTGQSAGLVTQMFVAATIETSLQQYNWTYPI